MSNARDIAIMFDQARLAHTNGMWFNSTINPGSTYGPFSGDSMTSQVAFGAAINAVAKNSGRPALDLANYDVVRTSTQAKIEADVEAQYGVWRDARWAKAQAEVTRPRTLLPCYCDSAYHPKGC